MRHSFGFMAPTPNVTRYLIVIIAFFILLSVFGNTSVGTFIFNESVLMPHRVMFSGEVWRLFTYAFLHELSSPMHVIMNALMLFMLGPPVEEAFGEKRFLLFTLGCILMGGIFVCIAYLIFGTGYVVLGFSAVSVGIVVAWGLTFPDESIYLLGILPILGKQIVWITLGIELIYAVADHTISSAAHFGGIAMAFIFVLGLYKPRRLKQLFTRARMKRNLRR